MRRSNYRASETVGLDLGTLIKSGWKQLTVTCVVFGWLGLRYVFCICMTHWTKTLSQYGRGVAGRKSEISSEKCSLLSVASSGRPLFGLSR